MNPQADSPTPAAALYAAWLADDPSGVEALLHDFPETRGLLNQPFPGSSFGSLPIHDAARKGNLTMVDVLLRAGADINARSHWWAGGFGVLSANAAMAEALIERGATVDGYDASKLGMLDRLRELLRADPAVVHMRGGDGQTPLHVAASLEIAQLLLEYGADIDARDVDHESTPAQYLVSDHPEIVRFLIARGCETDILMAAAVGDVDVVRSHLDANPDSIYTSVSSEWFPMQNPRAGGTIYQWMLGFHATPHMVARRCGHRGVLSLLMSRSPHALKLAEACASGDDAEVATLLAHLPPAERSIPDRLKRRVADAARNDDANAVHLMLDAGWPVDVRGPEGGTPLHWACWHGNANLVNALLRHAPSLDARDNPWNGTPMDWAIHASRHGWHPGKGDYAGTVQRLVDAGSPVPDISQTIDASDEVLAVLQRHARRTPERTRE